MSPPSAVPAGQEFQIGPASIGSDCADGYSGGLTVYIDGYAFHAGEKYTILELGWAVYQAVSEVPEEWMRKHGECRAAEGDCGPLETTASMLMTSHPVLVALALRAWWHRNGRRIRTAPQVPVPTFNQAVDRVRRRTILNDFNRPYAGQVPGLKLWSGRDL